MANLCSMCQKKIRFLEKKEKTIDGIICSSCLRNFEKVGMNDLEGKYRGLYLDKIYEIYYKKKELADKFEDTFHIGKTLIIDEKNKLLVIGSVLLEFENLKNVETKFQYAESSITNTKSKTKKGLGRAILGGVLFGGVGALTGALTAKNKTKTRSETTTSTFCSSATLILTLQNYYLTTYYIDLQSTYDKFYNLGYSSVEEFAEELKNRLNEIITNFKEEK